jgi:hypothetical protein
MAGELNRGPGDVPSRPPDPPPPSPKEPEISAQANPRSRPVEGRGLEPRGLEMTPEFSAALEQAKARIDERKATSDYLSPQRPEAAALPSHTRTPDARNDPDAGQGPLIKGGSRADASAQEAQLTARPRDARSDVSQGPLVSGGTPGKYVEYEPDPDANPRPPEDGRRLIIGKLDDLRYQSDRRNLVDPLAEPQRMPDLGSPNLNYDQNDRELRWEMGRGLPIQDASHDINTGELLHDTGFLRAERDILRDHEWEYQPDVREWWPPDDWHERRPDS